MRADFKSGFVTLIGRPNVGKSTLMNYLIGQKIAITSNKPQTTRNRIQTVLTTDEGQIVFVDTPGIHKAKNKLGTYMVNVAERTLNEVDVVLWLVEPSTFIGAGEQHIVQQLGKVTTPVVLVINKADTVKKEDILPCIAKYNEVYQFADIVPVSARNGDNTDDLINAIFQYLPYGPMYYDEDTITDQPMRQIVSELIREKALHALNEEIPHGIAVVIDSMKERKKVLWVIGDSTLSSFNDKYYYPRYGYGTKLAAYLDDAVEVKNIALSGRSSKSYTTEPQYKELLDKLQDKLNGNNDNDEKIEDFVDDISKDIENSTVADDIHGVADTVDSEIRTIADSIERISAQIKNIGNTVTETMDVVTSDDDYIEDISSADSAQNSDGVIAKSVNRGAVHGDINAGGIAGTMNVEYDVDPEYDLDITETTNVRLRSTVSDVVIYCINYGEVNSKKDCAGGIVGLQELGLVYGLSLIHI